MGTIPTMDASRIGRALLIVALVAGVAGGLLVAASALGLRRLPGDLAFGKGNVRVYVPLATSILVSVVATLVLNLAFRR